MTLYALIGFIIIITNNENDVSLVFLV